MKLKRKPSLLSLIITNNGSLSLVGAAMEKLHVLTGKRKFIVYNKTREHEGHKTLKVF